jgi:hypothetical protein
MNSNSFDRSPNATDPVISQLHAIGTLLAQIEAELSAVEKAVQTLSRVSKIIANAENN